VIIDFGFEWIQFYTGLPWWLIVVITSVFLRMAMFPLVVRQIKISSKMQEIMPIINEYNQNSAKSRTSKDFSFADHWLGINAIYKKHGVSPWSNLKVTALQIPLFVMIFIALRALCMRPEWHGEMSTGGIWWFTDLTAMDPYWIMPIVCGVSMLILVEIQNRVTGHVPGFALKWGSRGFSLFIVYITSQFPMGVNIYWAISSVIGTCNVALFLSNRFRKLVGLNPREKPAPKIVNLPSTQPTVTPDPQKIAKDILSDKNWGKKLKKKR